jgi:hypothetical protein
MTACLPSGHDQVRGFLLVIATIFWTMSYDLHIWLGIQAAKAAKIVKGLFNKRIT